MRQIASGYMVGARFDPGQQRGCTMGQRIECSIRILAPPPVVWEQAHNPARRAEWDGTLVAAQYLTAGAPRRGSRCRLTYRATLLRPWLEVEYSVWQPPE